MSQDVIAEAKANPLKDAMDAYQHAGTLLIMPDHWQGDERNFEVERLLNYLAALVEKETPE